jgi:hypothetical protein
MNVYSYAQLTTLVITKLKQFQAAGTRTVSLDCLLDTDDNLTIGEALAGISLHPADVFADERIKRTRIATGDVTIVKLSDALDEIEALGVIVPSAKIANELMKGNVLSYGKYAYIKA